MIDQTENEDEDVSLLLKTDPPTDTEAANCDEWSSNNNEEET